MPDTQELRDGLVSFVNRSVNAYARRHHGGRSGGDSGCSSTSGDGREQHVPDGNNTDAERPIKQRRISPTQPGRGIRKIVDLYHDLTDLLDKAKKHSSIINELDPTMIEEMNKIDFVGMSKEEIEEEQKDRKRCHTALKLLNTLIPGFEQKATAAENTASYCAPLQTGANDARSDDTSRLKVVIAEWLNSRTTQNRLSARGKDERGINHDITGRLLCPIDYDWDNDNVRAKLRNGDEGYDLTSSFFLHCLYEDESGDPDSPDVGFLKGPLLIRAFRHIFTAPSSASAEDTSECSSRRRDVATSLRLNGHVTPRSIAYTATQLIFALNSARDWKQEHNSFHYPSFYNFIIDFFDDTEDDASIAAVNELLQWWNSKVFPATARPSGIAVSRSAMRSSQERLRASRSRARQTRTESELDT